MLKSLTRTTPAPTTTYYCPLNVLRFYYYSLLSTTAISSQSENTFDMFQTSDSSPRTCYDWTSKADEIPPLWRQFGYFPLLFYKNQAASKKMEIMSNISHTIVFSFELYFAFFPLSFFFLPGLFLWAANSLVNSAQTVLSVQNEFGRKKSFHKGMSESFQYSVEQTTRGNLWCFQNSNVWQRKLGKFFVVLIRFNTFSCVAPIIIIDIIFPCQLLSK